MSWDVFVQNIPHGARSVDDIRDDLRPQTIGSRAEIIAKIREFEPRAEFNEPGWGSLEIPGAVSVDFNLGDEDPLRSFALHLRGEGAAAFVVALLEHLSLRAFDPQSPTGIFEAEEASNSLRRWQEYRDDALNDAAT